MTRVDELIQQLQNLQVQQKELTARLAKEREKEKKANTAEPSFRIGQKVSHYEYTGKTIRSAEQQHHRESIVADGAYAHYVHRRPS